MKKTVRTYRKYWLREQDVHAIDVTRKGIFLRSTGDPQDEKKSELDIPVKRLSGDVYGLDRSRATPGEPFSVYCAHITVT